MQVFQPPGRKRAVFFVKFRSGAERDGRETGFLMGTWLPPAEFRAIVCGKMSEGKMNRTNGRNVPDPALSPSRALFRRLAAQDGEFEPPELFQQLFRRFPCQCAVCSRFSIGNLAEQFPDLLTKRTSGRTQQELPDIRLFAGKIPFQRSVDRKYFWPSIHSPVSASPSEARVSIPTGDGQVVI